MSNQTLLIMIGFTKEPILDQPNALDTLLPLLQNVVFDGDRLTQTHEGNMQVLHQQQHPRNRDVELPSNTQIDLLQQPNVVENEQPNVVDNSAIYRSLINMMLSWNWRKNKTFLSKQEQSLNG